jgi:YidC/Oxa1 family membrane protein insertase
MDIQRIVILLGLAITAYLMVLKWNEDYGPQATPEQPVEISADETTLPGMTSVPTSPGEIPAPAEATEERPQPATTVPESEARVDSNLLVEVKTDVLDIVIDRLGGDVVKASLPAFPEKIDTPDVPFLLVDPRNHYVIQSGLIGADGTDKADGRPLYTASRMRYEIGDADQVVVDLKHTTDAGVNITKRFTLSRGDYLVQLEYIVENGTGAPFTAALFGQIKRDGQIPVTSEENGMRMRPYTGGATFVPGSPYTKVKFDDLEDQPYRASVEGGYMAMVQHYFLSAWIPEESQKNTYHARKLPGQDIYLLGFTSPLWRVEPGQQYVEKAAFYVGPKDQYRLEKITPGLNLTVDYGFLWWLAQPLFGLLTFIHGLVHNWGISIILLTMIVKALLYPLSAASFKSMAKMRRLQPEMTRLKERYGDDRQQFSQAMMELYKKEGANPLGGCLPILLQMPVFLALYWTLMESVELRQSPFFLWIHDLSDMDPYFVLPILMGISMFITQMLQPEPPDPVQAKVFKLMPIMFTFFFLWFPSGLVLYWLVNNILSILQQWYVTRQLEKSS